MIARKDIIKKITNLNIRYNSVKLEYEMKKYALSVIEEGYIETITRKLLKSEVFTYDYIRLYKILDLISKINYNETIYNFNSFLTNFKFRKVKVNKNLMTILNEKWKTLAAITDELDKIKLISRTKINNKDGTKSYDIYELYNTVTYFKIICCSCPAFKFSKYPHTCKHIT